MQEKLKKLEDETTDGMVVEAKDCLFCLVQCLTFSIEEPSDKIDLLK